MDTFLKEEYILLFKLWISIKLEHLHINYQLIHNSYQITYQNKKATITIYPIGIIEETITQNNQTIFYLHYELKQLHLAINYFNKMIDQLTLPTNNNKLNILLCCSGGMTTSFFATKLNEYCKLNQLNIHIAATAYYNIDQVYQGYDMIFIAPQLKYQVIPLSQKYPHIHIESIDPIIFATYDCNQFIKHIEEVNHE